MRLTAEQEEARDRRLRRACRLGLSQRDVGERIGMSQRWVCDRMRELGLAPNGYASEASRAKRSETMAAVTRLGAIRGVANPDPGRGAIDAIWIATTGDDLGGVPGGGYGLFGALCRAGWPIHGDASLRISGEGPRLRVRGPRGVLDGLLDCPRHIEAGHRPITLSHPSISELAVPHPDLRAAMVSVSGKVEAGPMRDWCLGELDRIGVGGRVVVGGRGVVRPRGRAIVGFGVGIYDLTPRDSLVIQSIGLGGRGRFGCGVFLPC